MANHETIAVTEAELEELALEVHAFDNNNSQQARERARTLFRKVCAKGAEGVADEPTIALTAHNLIVYSKTVAHETRRRGWAGEDAATYAVRYFDAKRADQKKDAISATREEFARIGLDAPLPADPETVPVALHEIEELLEVALNTDRPKDVRYRDLAARFFRARRVDAEAPRAGASSPFSPVTSPYEATVIGMPTARPALPPAPVPLPGAAPVDPLPEGVEPTLPPAMRDIAIAMAARTVTLMAPYLIATRQDERARIVKLAKARADRAVEAAQWAPVDAADALRDLVTEIEEGRTA